MNRKTYRKIAKKHGVSVKDVKRDMQIAIDEAYKKPNSFAKSIPSKGEKPSIDEVVDFLSAKVKEKK